MADLARLRQLVHAGRWSTARAEASGWVVALEYVKQHARSACAERDARLHAADNHHAESGDGDDCPPLEYSACLDSGDGCGDARLEYFACYGHEDPNGDGNGDGYGDGFSGDGRSHGDGYGYRGQGDGEEGDGDGDGLFHDPHRTFSGAHADADIPF